jgi:hypothetical protein
MAETGNDGLDVVIGCDGLSIGFDSTSNSRSDPDFQPPRAPRARRELGLAPG